jgi:sulfonate transport system ATP-binding protein
MQFAPSIPERKDQAHASGAGLVQGGSSRGGTLDIRIERREFAGSQGNFVALRDIRLTIRPGEFVCIVGGSGCGKTTLLRIIAGLDTSYYGSVLLDGKPITGPGLDRGVVFQEHRLLPWLTTHDNVGFGLARMSYADRTAKIRRYVKLVGLEDFEQEYPHQLSGGMSQRVALARALAGQPEVLLLDEPFASLDAITRVRLQEELLRLWEAERMTVVLVTHDIEEAVYLADRVIILSRRPGTVQKVMDVSLARPRERTSEEFGCVRKELMDEFFAPGGSV